MYCRRHVEHCSDGVPNGNYYVPHESDITIQNPGDAWFWHEGHVFLSGAELFTHYLTTVGRGSTFIVNMPPNTTGIVPEEFVESVRVMNTAVKESFGADVASHENISATCQDMVVVIEAPNGAVFDTVMMQEDLSHGQVILSYTLEVRDTSGTWTQVSTAHGQTVGRRLIDLLPASLQQAVGAVTAARFTCTSHMGSPGQVATLSKISLHKLSPPPIPHRTVPLQSYYSTSGKVDMLHYRATLRSTASQCPCVDERVELVGARCITRFI
eukprot:m.521846 g.521846  ORF g.521846 m.521846 type:complete len:269 (+) comp21965_c0_seq1:1202-2008(+)